MKTIRYGLLGCGYAASIHADNLRKLNGAAITAVFDTDGHNARGFAQRFGVEVAPSQQALCDREDVDAVLVCTPNWAHQEGVMAAVQAKKAVFCEKPVALRYEDVSGMTGHAAKAGVPLFAGHCLHFMEGIRAVKALLRDQAMGEILTVDVRHADWSEPTAVAGWKQRKAFSGGHLYHHMHEVDLICRFAGLPVSVYALGGNLAHNLPGCGDEDDAIYLLMELEGGRFASLQIGSAFHSGAYDIRINGEKGAITIDFRQAAVTVCLPGETRRLSLYGSEEHDEERRSEYRNSGDDGKRFGRPGMRCPGWMEALLLREIGCFHRLLQTGEIEEEYRCLIDGSAPLDCALLLDCATRSIDMGLPVRLFP